MFHLFKKGHSGKVYQGVVNETQVAIKEMKIDQQN